MKHILGLICIMYTFSSCKSSEVVKNPQVYSMQIYNSIKENDIEKFIELVYYGKGTSDTIQDKKWLQHYNDFLLTYGIGDTGNLKCENFANLGLSGDWCTINFYSDSLGDSSEVISELAFVFFNNKSVAKVNLVAEIRGLAINTRERYKLFFRNTNLIDEYQVIINLKNIKSNVDQNIDTSIFYTQNNDTEDSYLEFKKVLYGLMLEAKIDTILPYNNETYEVINFGKIEVETVLEGSLFGNQSISIESFINPSNDSGYDLNFITVKFHNGYTFYLDKTDNPKLDNLMNNIYNCKGIVCQ